MKLKLIQKENYYCLLDSNDNYCGFFDTEKAAKKAAPRIERNITNFEVNGKPIILPKRPARPKRTARPKPRR